jgi:DUF917 family protein
LQAHEAIFNGQALCRSVEELAQFAGVELDALVPLELGGSNSVYPLVLAARLGLRCVDGDYVGRAVPEIAQTAPVLADRAVTPLCSIDRWGDVCFIKAANGPQMAERIGKMLSVAAFSGCLMTGFLMRGGDMKELVVRLTLGRCLELGRAVRRAREVRADPVKAIVDCTSGCLLFEGEVLKKEWEDRGGYMFGTTFLTGLGRFAGHTMDIWFKNENHVAWKDREPIVTSPDIIALVELGTGEPKTNAAVAEADRVAVVGVAGPAALSTSRGLAALGPQHFGFDFDYLPIHRGLETRCYK